MTAHSFMSLVFSSLGYVVADDKCSCCKDAMCPEKLVAESEV